MIYANVGAVGNSGQDAVRDQRLIRLEGDLHKVAGVRSARVVGVDTPSEIHIVSDLERSPKQLVRDVQSLASAGFGMPIDHRIVSVVQLDDPSPQTDERSTRLIVESVIVGNRRENPWVKVVLSWPGGEGAEGGCYATDSKEGKALAAAEAVAKALSSALRQRGTHVMVDQVQIQRLGSDDSVVARVNYITGADRSALVGSALIRDDVATAAVYAVLQAVNRRIDMDLYPSRSE